MIGLFEFRAAARTFVLGSLVRCAVAAVACAFVHDPSLLATAGVCVLVLGSFVLSAGAQACCSAWIGSSRAGSHVLRPRALRRR